MTDFSSMSDDDLLSAYQKAKTAGAPPASPQAPAAKASPLDSAIAAENVPAPVADIARSIYQQESGSGRNTKTSNAGAVGGMQIIPATFKSVADPDWDINNPEHNARAGVRYISQMYAQAGGDPALTAAGYYGGPGGLEKARQGIAVSDPRNPNAPNTLQYGQQVAARLPQQSDQVASAAAPAQSPFAGMSDADLLAAYQKAKSPDSQQLAQQKPLAWSDVPAEAVKNLIPSAVNVGKGIVQAVAHPLDTAGNLMDLAAGGLRNALPASVSRLIDSVDTNPQAAARATQVADNIGAFYKDRYGSADGIKNALATDPAGVASDVAGVLSGGAGAVAKGAGLVGKIADFSGAARLAGAADRVGQIANTAGDAANLVNPVNLGAQAVKTGILAPAKFIGSNALGLTTGVGGGTIRDAAKAGIAGDSSFLDNLSGKANLTDVLDAARQNVQEMGRQKSAAYRSGMADISKDQSVLNFDGIDKALQEADAMGKYKGQVKNPQAAQAVNSIANEVNNWKSLNPADFHTPEGMDALKQKIGGILESIPFEQKTARTAAGNVYNAVKGTIADQAPTYAKVMKDYADASDQIREVERALSLGQNASADTALRKLQSLTRNNANTNYGYRQQLADAMQQQGGQNIAPALAGQAMSSWTPRGLMAAAQLAAHTAAGLSTGGASLAGTLATLPVASPRLVGYGLYGAGRGAGILQGLASRVPVSSAGLNGVSQAGNLSDRNGTNRLMGVTPAYADGGLVDDTVDNATDNSGADRLAGMARESAMQTAAQDAHTQTQRNDSVLSEINQQQAHQIRADQAGAEETRYSDQSNGIKLMYSDIASSEEGIGSSKKAVGEAARTSRGNEAAGLESMGYDVQELGYANGGMIGQDALQGDTFEERISAAYAAGKTPYDDLGNGRRQLINPDGTAGDTVMSSAQATPQAIGRVEPSIISGLMAQSAFNNDGGGAFNGKIFRSFKNGGMVGAPAMDSPVRALAFGRGRRRA